MPYDEENITNSVDEDSELEEKVEESGENKVEEIKSHWLTEFSVRTPDINIKPVLDKVENLSEGSSFDLEKDIDTSNDVNKLESWESILSSRRRAQNHPEYVTGMENQYEMSMSVKSVEPPVLSSRPADFNFPDDFQRFNLLDPTASIARTVFGGSAYPDRISPKRKLEKDDDDRDYLVDPRA